MKKTMLAMLAVLCLGACGSTAARQEAAVNQTVAPGPAQVTPWGSGNVPVPRDRSFRGGYSGGPG